MLRFNKRCVIFNVPVIFNSSRSLHKLLGPEPSVVLGRRYKKLNYSATFLNNRRVPQQVCAKQDLKVQLNAHNKPLKRNKQEVSRRHSLLALSVRKAHKPVFKQLRRRVNLACRLRN